MCGIDELFSSNSLAEKTELTECFIQTPDEDGASGDFREILEKHFSASWQGEFGSIENVEKALKCARRGANLPEKISIFVQTIDKKSFNNSRLGSDFSLKPVDGVRSLLQKFENDHPSRVAFAKDVATRVFQKTPYGFYECFKTKDNTFLGFILFYASPYFGESCYLSSQLFNDERLGSVGKEERHKILWQIFEYMVCGQLPFRENLKNLLAWEIDACVPTRETLLFSEAFDYLSAWIESDAQTFEYSQSLDLLTSAVDFLNRHENEILYLCADRESEVSSKDFGTWIQKWFKQKHDQLSKAWCCNVNLKGLSDDNLETWARKSYDCFLPLCNDLTEKRAAVLISWGLKNDLGKWLNPKIGNRWLLDYMSRSELWYVSAFRETWRSQLLDSINALPLEEQLRVLGLPFGWDIKLSARLLPHYCSLPYESYRETENDGYYEFHVENNNREWWDSLLRVLPDDDSFPKELYPLWTLNALSRFGYCEDMVPPVDKSLGVVRGDFASGKSTITAEDIDRLLKVLERFSPEKAMRHRLLLLRSSYQPYATENLDIDRNCLRPETMAEILQAMSAAHFRDETRRKIPYGDEYLKEELLIFSSTRAWVAQFCLSRLNLRKGEKAGKDSYEPEQVVEPSATWRKAYLKVLEELSVDLGGKVHKTINFTRKFDPVEDVRDVAKTCYKAVRREHNKSETTTDIRRGLTAAYWWLLLAQRHDLGLPVNEEEAVRTRRRLLRRP
jgi:hypothetical protein